MLVRAAVTILCLLVSEPAFAAESMAAPKTADGVPPCSDSGAGAKRDGAGKKKRRLGYSATTMANDHTRQGAPSPSTAADGACSQPGGSGVLDPRDSKGGGDVETAGTKRAAAYEL